MKQYNYSGKAYSSLWELRKANPNLVFPATEEGLELAGIEEHEIPDPEPSEEAKLKRIEAAIDLHIEDVMNERAYDSITSCITYLGSTNKRWDQDARDAIAWRTAVWEKAYELLNAYKAGEIAELTPDQVIAQLPEMKWTYSE